MQGKKFELPPKNTVLGALMAYVLGCKGKYFAPMNANWALLPMVNKYNKEEAIQKAINEIQEYYKKYND